MIVKYGNEIVELPDGMSEEEMAEAMSQLDLQNQQQPDSFFDNTLDVLGEGAQAFNQGITEGLDFLGPGTINAGLKLAGSDARLPTFTEGLQSLPGGEGGFMDEGVARDVVRGAGGAASAIPGMISAGPRNLAKNSDAALELLGFGSGTNTAGVLADLSGDLTRTPPMVSRADDVGFPLTPGDRTGNKTLKKIDAAIDSTPMFFNPMHRMQDIRQQQMNAAAAQSIGLPAGTPLIDDTIGNTADNLSAVFKSLDEVDDLDVDEAFVQRLLDVGNKAKSRLFSNPDVNATINNVFDKVDDSGKLSTPDYQDMSSELKTVIRAAWRGESPDAYFAKSMQGIVDALDKLAMNGMDAQALSELKRARAKWKALGQLEKSRALHESGDVSGPLLANYLRRTDKGGYGRGGNKTPLYETARLTKAFPQQPNSGTADRQLWNQMKQHPMSGLFALATAPITSTAANVYMEAPSIIAGASRMAKQDPSIMRALYEMSERPGALAATPLRGIGALFNEEDQ